MAINVKVKVQTNIVKYIQDINRRNREFAIQGAVYLAKEIKEDIWRDQDTQTGNIRRRRFDIGGVVSDGNNFIIGSTTEENPNIETSKLVDSIRAGRNTPQSQDAFVIADADNGTYNYADFINDRNKFLQRGYYRKKAQLRQLHKLILTGKNA